MAIKLRLRQDETLKGFIRKSRRERIAEILANIPAEIIDESGKPVTLTIERVPRNIYWIEASVPDYSRLRVLDSEKVLLDTSLRGNPVIYYYESVQDAGKHCMKERSYHFELVRGQIKKA